MVNCYTQKEKKKLSHWVTATDSQGLTVSLWHCKYLGLCYTMKFTCTRAWWLFAMHTTHLTNEIDPPTAAAVWFSHDQQKPCMRAPSGLAILWEIVIDTEHDRKSAWLHAWLGGTRIIMTAQEARTPITLPLLAGCSFYEKKTVSRNFRNEKYS